MTETELKDKIFILELAATANPRNIFDAILPSLVIARLKIELLEMQRRTLWDDLPAEPVQEELI